MLVYALAIAVCAFALDAGERERAEVAEARELDNEWRMLREPVPRLESAADNALRRRRLDASARGRQLMQQMQAAAARSRRCPDARTTRRCTNVTASTLRGRSEKREEESVGN